MIKQQVFIFLVIFVNNSFCFIETLYDLAEEVRTFYSLLNDVDLHNMKNSRKINEDLSTTLLRIQIHKVYVELKAMEISINHTVIQSLSEIMESQIMPVVVLDTMQLFIGNINEDFEKFNNYIDNNRIEDLVKSVFTNNEPNIAIIRKIMTQPKELLPGYGSLIAAITDLTKNHYDEMCRTSQLISEMLIQLFKAVMIAEIKIYVMLGFANKYQYTENKGWNELNFHAGAEFQTYFGRYINIFIEHLGQVDNLYLRACDPDNGTWILNDNCFELEGTARAMLFRYRSTGCPSQTCSSNDQAKWNQCDAKYYEERDDCPSRLTDCSELGPVKTCISRKSPRRLQYMDSLKLGLIGKKSACTSDTDYIINDDRSTFDYLSCSCNCYGNHSKISLLAMKSRVELNRVITGLRFIRKDNILHIQIKEGLLEAQGYINSSTNQWLPIPDEIDSSLIHSIGEENRNFFLDDVRLQRDSVLTGIQFEEVTRGTVTGFRIRIHGVLFNYQTGELNPQNKMTVAMSTDGQEERVSFNPISSLATKLTHKPGLGDINYIELERSHLTDHFGQTTLPLFDAVPVSTDPPSTLNGVGIFHKGVDDFAGFISLKVFGIKFKKYFNEFKAAHMPRDVVEFRSFQ